MDIKLDNAGYTSKQLQDDFVTQEFNVKLKCKKRTKNKF